MKLKDYIKLILDQSEPGDVYFEINLYADGSVAEEKTGNVIKFTTYKSNETT